MEAEEKLRATEAQLEKEQDLKAKYQPFEKEVQKLKEIVEAKSVDVDHLQGDLETALKEKAQLAKQLEKVTAHVARLSDVERDWKDLESKYLMDKATINTLQNNLVQEKLVAQQLKASMARLGLAVDQLGDPDSVLDKMLSNAEIVEAVKEKLATEGRTEGLQEENARLSVTLSTLQSQVTSLNTQHTAQKLANSQLVAEKEELSKRLDAMIDQHQQLLVDHLTLQSLHEQLTAEYEALSREKENIRGEAKRARNEARELRETEERLQNQISVLMSDVEKTKVDSSSLANLRHEHSKLKEDFRNLFTASEKMKSEFKAAQDEYKSMNSKFRTLSLEQTEVQGELSAREENIQRLEVQVAKLTNDNQRPAEPPVSAKGKTRRENHGADQKYGEPEYQKVMFDNVISFHYTQRFDPRRKRRRRRRRRSERRRARSWKRRRNSERRSRMRRRRRRSRMRWRRRRSRMRRRRRSRVRIGSRRGMRRRGGEEEGEEEEEEN
ncbi:unnamed protein product [Nesidiocoris tenuis]|uniref:Uncharacterized protein n=1 Tax=Nesidiocoris tenuis TaxID=355587 RepID=A0A6H5GL47_9HEMI|nr:unnamed protein product [Nesidiocoris tenuis]